MRSDAPRLLPVLRSQHQADLLAVLLLHPEQEYTIADLTQRLRIPQSTVSGEVRRLADADILTVRPVGRSRLVRANASSRLVGSLTELVTLTYGPHVVIADEFADLQDVASVVIFGSWAARYQGQRGMPPDDVDVLVVGAPDRIAMYGAAERAESRLGRPVNPTVCSPDQWAQPAEPFIVEVKSRPYVTVIDDAADATAGAE
ncbi:MAG TPA: winged helix-turn-helix domain-containing protein [Streptosporangiaceae bacterium]|nr:winged helix-turn-helix domain-containing protein [Streptosporangiaceae bacterium]